jgi:metal-sulfur cluster biosynthetic enzyme
LNDLKKGIDARKRKVKVDRNTVTVKATPTKEECELQKNLTFQIEMAEDHQQELAEELK